MTAMSAKTRLAALLSATAIVATACGTMTDTSSEPGEPRRGGTLRLVGSGDVVNLDTASAYYVPTWMLLRAMTRQLLSYEYTEDFEAATTPVPDLAEGSPAISADQLTYTFTIREGARWDVGEEGRQIVAQDIVRGFKRLCNPSVPSGAIGYYAGTIVGLQEYCDAWAADVQERGADFEVTTQYIKEWVEGDEHPVEGLRAVDDRTIQFRLRAPASDFPNILAMSFASPVPVEMMEYLPDSPEYRENFISSGPYRLERYVPNQSIYLERNPTWDGGSDDLREAWVDRIEIVEGSDEGPVQRQIEAGTADLAWDTNVPAPDVVKHLALQSPQLTTWQDSSITYLVLNLYSEESALQDVNVRKAINMAIDKEAVAQLQGGPPLVKPWHQILTPQVIHPSGFQEYNPYPPDVEQARQLIEDYEAQNGEITLTFPYRNANFHPRVAESIKNDLEEVGIEIDAEATTQADFYSDYLFDADGAKSGEWDIAVPGWTPDWYGNAGRSFLVPLLDGRYCGNNSTNYGCYNNEEVIGHIEAALAAPNAEEAATEWMAADQRAMQDAPWVPLTVRSTARFHSERVGGYIVSTGLNVPDLTNLWLESE